MNLILLFLIISIGLCDEPKDKIIDLNYNYDEANIKCHFVNLTSSNFDNLVQNGNNNRWLIMFYTEDCSFCKQIKNMINKIIEDKEFNYEIKFGKVDLMENLQLQIRFNITKIPYIVLVNHNKMYEMKFLPTESSFANFIDSTNFDEFKDLQKDFPENLSLFEFLKKLVIFSFSDGAMKLNRILEKYNFSFKFTALSLFIYSFIIGVPIATFTYIFILRCLFSKKVRKNEFKENLNENKEKEKEKDNNIKNEVNENNENNKIKKE
jgi:glutaredoxin